MREVGDADADGLFAGWLRRLFGRAPQPAPPAQKLFFFHNPKAGGASIRKMLEPLIEPPGLCPLIENGQFEHSNREGHYAAFKGYDHYVGHYGYDIFQEVRDRHLYFTNFRHPVSRLISLYNYFRCVVHAGEEERPETFAVRLAQSVSFEEFVGSTDDRVSVYISDHHFRQLSDSGWALGASKSVADVCDFIDSMPWYYVCEYPELSLSWARSALGWDTSTVVWENATCAEGTPPSLLTISRDVRNRVAALNTRDLAIYRHAVARFLERAVD